MSYLDHTNLRRFVSNFKNYIISRINGKAEAVHAHSASEITSGTLDTSRIPNLDASKITTGVIDIDRLPQGALERLVTVANQTARFALTSTDVQLGDTVKQTDTGMMYIVTDTANLGNNNGYTEYTAGSATSVPWSGVTGKPSFASVATSGSYNDLTDKPTIPTVPTNYVTTDTTQTVSGQKTWTGSNRFRSFGVQSANTIDITQSTYANSQNCGGIGFSDAVNRFWGDIELNVNTDAASEMIFNLSNWKANGDQGVTALRFRYDKALTTVDFFGANGITNLGTSTNQWASVYAQAYYYNGTEFQNKFATVDTDQTITGDKTFQGYTEINKQSGLTTATAVADCSLAFNNQSSLVFFRTRGSSNFKSYNSFLWSGYLNSSTPNRYGRIKLCRSMGVYGDANEYTPDTSFSFIDFAIHYKFVNITDNVQIINDGTENAIKPVTNNATDLGTSSSRWKTLNGIAPGKLSLPQYGFARIDISSVITNTAWGANLYTPPVDGWLAVLIESGRCIIQQNGTYGLSAGSYDTTDVYDLRVFCPAVAGATYEIYVRGTVKEASLYPCQGNV